MFKSSKKINIEEYKYNSFLVIGKLECVVLIFIYNLQRNQDLSKDIQTQTQTLVAEYIKGNVNMAGVKVFYVIFYENQAEQIYFYEKELKLNTILIQYLNLVDNQLMAMNLNSKECPCELYVGTLIYCASLVPIQEFAYVCAFIYSFNF